MSHYCVSTYPATGQVDTGVGGCVWSQFTT